MPGRACPSTTFTTSSGRWAGVRSARLRWMPSPSSWPLSGLPCRANRAGHGSPERSSNAPRWATTRPTPSCSRPGAPNRPGTSTGVISCNTTSAAPRAAIRLAVLPRCWAAIVGRGGTSTTRPIPAVATGWAGSWGRVTRSRPSVSRSCGAVRAGCSSCRWASATRPGGAAVWPCGPRPGPSWPIPAPRCH